LYPKRSLPAVLGTFAVLVAGMLAPAPASAALAAGTFENRVLTNVVKHRDSAGEPRVRRSSCADAFAARWARVAHRGDALPGVATVRSRCGGPVTRVVAVRTKATPAATVRSWRRSAGSRRALLATGPTRAGVGSVRDAAGRWTTVVVLTGVPAPARASTSTEGSPTIAEQLTALRKAIYIRTNKRRQSNGLPAFKRAPCAAKFAQGHSRWMARNGAFEHADMHDLLDACSQSSAVGENIAYNSQPDGPRVVQMWMQSPGHRANILNGRFTHLGVGVAYDASSGRFYATQDFSTSRY
jgi:uncharacterized protein YkwD